VIVRGIFLKGVGVDVLWPQLLALLACGVFVRRVRLPSRRLKGGRDDRPAGLQQGREDVRGIEATLIERAQHGGQHLLGVGPAPRAIAATDRARDDGLANRVLRAPVVASMAGSPSKVSSAVASVVRCAATRWTSGTVERVVVSTSRICGKRRPRATARPCGDTCPAATRSRSAGSRCKACWIWRGSALRG